MASISLIEGFFVGIFAAITIVYTFQTKILYPPWILHLYDNPWILLIGILIGLFLLSYSPPIGAMVILATIGIWMDAALFTQKPKVIEKMRNFKQMEDTYVGGPLGPDRSAQANGVPIEVWPYEAPALQRFSDSVMGPPLDGVALSKMDYSMYAEA